jgi:hypothetical protein
VGEPFDSATAKKYVRGILSGAGHTTFTTHAWAEMAKDRMSSVDVVNVLRGGKISVSKFEKGCWRYRSDTQRMTVIVAFRGHEHDPESAAPNELAVITAWRNKP